MSTRTAASRPLIALPNGTHWNTTTGQVEINNSANLARAMRNLAIQVMFGDSITQEWAQWLIRDLALKLGIYPASIHHLYRAMARGELGRHFTVPAMNLRTLTFDLACAAFRQAKVRNAGALIFEIARSEIGYTGQSPAQYSAMIFAAAIATGWSGPIFVQGDHFQISKAKYDINADAELGTVERLIEEALAAWFFNIDVDTSTMVDLDKRTLREQQRLNAQLTAHFLRFIRNHQPPGVTVSVGGEIGEVGGRNSRTVEFRAYMTELVLHLLIGGGDLEGLSKISLQTGTAHGGIVLPDGSLAEVDLDTNVLRLIGRWAARDHGMIVVQHGASTLPPEAFGIIWAAGAGECHLATAFQFGVLDNLDAGFIAMMKEWIRKNKGGPKGDQTEAQWWWANAKHALGPFVNHIWNANPWHHEQAVRAVEEQFALIFDAFNIRDTAPLVAQYAPLTYQLPNPRPDQVATVVATRPNEDVSDLAD